jgi:hypothetical protein
MHPDAAATVLPVSAAYFRLSFDPEKWPRWFPNEPRTPGGGEVDTWAFTTCKRYTGEEPLTLSTNLPGPRSPITFGPFDILIVDTALGAKLAEVAPADVQLVPAITEEDDVFILNALRELDCIDEGRTVGERWMSGDGRPEKVGEYRSVVELFVDPDRATGAHVFRLVGWGIPLIVSAEIVAVLDREAVDGVRLTRVS